MSAFSQGMTAGIDGLIDPMTQRRVDNRKQQDNLGLIEAQAKGANPFGSMPEPGPVEGAQAQQPTPFGGLNPFGQMAGGTDAKGMPIDPKMLMQLAPMLMGMPPMVG
jgi:hypothetical protein